MNKKKISILLFGLATCLSFALFSPQESEASRDICSFFSEQHKACMAGAVNCLCEIIVEAPRL